MHSNHEGHVCDEANCGIGRAPQSDDDDARPDRSTESVTSSKASFQEPKGYAETDQVSVCTQIPDTKAAKAVVDPGNSSVAACKRPETSLADPKFSFRIWQLMVSFSYDSSTI